MPPKRLELILLLGVLWIARPATGADPTSVALTMTRPAEATKDLELAENLLELVEVAVQADKSLAVVERRNIDLVIQELVLDRSRPGDSQLQLGKLITADFLAMLELLPPEKDSPKPFVRLRVVDPKTAAIRGVTVARLDEETIEETSEQFARYVSALIQAPEKPTVTVAVAPFESKGRFDRLRPLELGIRDLVTARLLELSGAAPPDPPDPQSKQAPAEPLRFQVLQRSNMEQLLRELDLIQSGFSDRSRLPETLPARGAAYLVRGEINERQAEDQYTVIVRGEMVQARSMQVVDQFEFRCPPQDLATQLAAEIDRFGERLLKVENIGLPKHLAAIFEVQSFKQQTLADVVRFRRKDPRTGWRISFHFPKQPSYWAPRSVDVRSLLGRHLLHKSIDHLESVLFMTPDDAGAAYALGFCYSIDEPEFYRPDRADELLRKVYTLGPQTALGGLALEYLSQIDFDDSDGHLIDGHEAEAIERTWFAFANTPRQWRRDSWKFLKQLGKLHRRPEQSQALAELVIQAAPIVERTPQKDHKDLGAKLHDLAVQLVRQARDQPEPRETGFALLGRWADGDDKELAYWGRKGLTTLAADNQDFIASGEASEASAALLVDLKSPQERDRHDALLIDAAKFYRSGGDPQRALKLLKSFEVRFPAEKDSKSTNDLLGLREYEIGRCHEMLGHRELALAAFLHATKINPTVSNKTDIVRRIERLGGVQLDKNRDVDVQYYPFPRGDRQGFIPNTHLATGSHKDSQNQFAKAAGDISNLHLATDGHKLYLGGEQGVRVFDLANQSWQPTPAIALPVTCIKGRDGQIFAGTKSDGLWTFDVSSARWQRACPLEKLPDPHVESLALDGHDVYVGVGTSASGGLVKIDSDGNIHVFNEPNAPAVAPTHIVVAKNRVFACTIEAVYEWSAITEAWFRKDPGTQRGHLLSPQLFAGSGTIWMSQQGRELARWQASDQENARFQPAWNIPANNKDYVVRYHQKGYAVYFVAQRGDEVWFGGEPWAPFVSSGLYRFNLKTAAFHRFSSADGFRPSPEHYIYDGLWLEDRLWLATSEGLCAVKPIGPSSVENDSQPAD